MEMAAIPAKAIPNKMARIFFKDMGKAILTQDENCQKMNKSLQLEEGFSDKSGGAAAPPYRRVFAILE